MPNFDGSSIPKLTDDNYSEWLVDIRALLRRKALWACTQEDMPTAKDGQLQEAADLITPTVSNSIKKRLSKDDFDNGYLMLKKLSVLLQPEESTKSEFSLSQLTAEALVDLQSPKDVRISPSGLHVVYSLHPASKKGEHEVSSIWVADIGHQHSARPLTSGPFNDKLPQWSPDGNDIAFVSDRAEHGESSAVYLISKVGGEPRPITKAENKKKISSLSWSSNGEDIAFLSADEDTPEKEAKKKKRDDAKVYGQDWEYNRLRIVHIESGEINTLFDDDKHVDKFTWNGDSTEIAYILHETPDQNSSQVHGSTLARSSVTAKETSAICKFPGWIGSLIWFEDYLYFIAGVTPNKANTSKMLYRVHETQSEWVPVAFGATNCASDLRFTSKGPSVQVLEGLTDKICLMSGSPDHSPKLIHQRTAEISTWDVLTPSNKEPILVIGTSSSDHPTEIYSQDADKLCQLSQHSGAFHPPQSATYSPILTTATDGTPLDGIFFFPPNAPPRPHPTVVAIHGGPYYRITNGFDCMSYAWTPWLLASGYAVLCPNYRGGSSHGEAFAADARGGMGGHDYADVLAVLEAGIARGLVDGGRVAVAGWSQGGFLSYLATTRAGARFRAAVCGAGVTDWDMLTMTSRFPSFEAELAGGAPWAMGPAWTAARQGSPVWHMRAGQMPVLLLHGEEDEIVPVTQAVAFHRGCLHYGNPCEMVVYPREPHAVVEREHRLDMLRRIRRFLGEHMSVG